MDLKSSARDREAFSKLLATADVLIESFRPGVMSRLGLGLESLRLQYPRLIVCSVSGMIACASRELPGLLIARPACPLPFPAHSRPPPLHLSPGYGQTGPLALAAGHDINYMARAGAFDLMDPASIAPLPVQVADLLGGAWPAALQIGKACFSCAQRETL